MLDYRSSKLKRMIDDFNVGGGGGDASVEMNIIF